MRSTLSVALSTIKTKSMLSNKPMIIFTLAYSARSESSVVKEPAPANKGKTTGMSVADLIGPMFLKITTSRIISSDMRKITKEPAMANEAISTLNKRSITSPAKKKPSNNPSEMSVAFHALTGRPCCFRLINIGVDPNTSITAKSTINALAICCMSRRSKR